MGSTDVSITPSEARFPQAGGWNVFQKLRAAIRMLYGRRQAASLRPPEVSAAHLKYYTVWDWMTGENVPMEFIREPDPVLRDTYLRQYGELRRHLYTKHVATLSSEVQKAINDGCHPSQSHQFAELAQPYCDQLRSHLLSLGLNVSAVHLGWYHMDRLVLSVETPVHPGALRLRELPWLFEGFEIKYVSTDQNAER